MRRSVVIGLALALLLEGAPLWADEYAPLPAPASALVPAGTASRGRAFPGYGPTGLADLAPAVRRTERLRWAEAAEAVALAHPGTRLAADLLFAAAEIHRRGTLTADLGQYRRLAHAAVDACRTGDPLQGAAMLGLAREELAAGNAPAAGRWLERAASAWGSAVASHAGDASVPPRYAALDAAWRRDYEPTRARWLEAEGRDADAAEIWATRAERATTDASSLWRRAAEAYVRAKRADDAERAIDQAIERAVHAAHRGEHALWRFYRRHGLLDVRARPAALAPDGAWPRGEAATRDLAELLGTLSPLPGVATLYLELGSRAHLGGNEATALDIYLAAMDNPFVVEEARGHPPIWEGLLVAFPAAIRLKRFGDAERILETVARIGEVPAERFDTLLIWLKKRRADAAQIEAFEQRVREEAARRRDAEATGRPRPSRARDAKLAVEGEGSPPVEPTGPPPPDAPLWPYLLGGALVALLALLAIRLLRRR